MQLKIHLPLFLALTFFASTTRAAPRQFGLPALTRSDFNRLAFHAGLPLYWVADTDKDALVDPSEIAARGVGKQLRRYVRGSKFTGTFQRAYRVLVELRRKEAISREVDAGRPTLVMSDFRQHSRAERTLLRHLLGAAKLIDQLYFRQTGGAPHQRAVKRAGKASEVVFHRNSGPWCSSPATRNDRFCNAVRSFPRRVSATYPKDLEQNKAMCAMLRRHPNSKALLDPFTVVRKRGGNLVAVPLHKAYGPLMRKVAAKLRAAARAIRRNKGEKAFHSYLMAAAKAFTDNDWGPADEAWAAMNSSNSAYYLRVGPDEVYVDPCQQKAGFHLTLARIDPQSLAWKRKLMPLRDEMERSLAKLIGPSYRARSVKFDMPDFIHIVLNAGDSRHPLGATIGQSLPNWGKVANEGRRRTMVMSNLYTDADSLQIKELKAKALLSRQSRKYFTRRPEPGLLDTILHEAGHNFGPDSGFRLGGKMPKEVFGGGLASTLEELKAQTLALWYLELLVRRKILTVSQARQSYTSSVMWAFGHISRGMTSASGQPKPYSQLAAIQMGWLLDHGGLTRRGGVFTIHFDKIGPAITQLMRRVGVIKATGDVKRAKALVQRYTNERALRRLAFDHLKKELLKYPKAAFDYSIQL